MLSPLEPNCIYGCKWGLKVLLGHWLETLRLKLRLPLTACTCTASSIFILSSSEQPVTSDSLFTKKQVWLYVCTFTISSTDFCELFYHKTLACTTDSFGNSTFRVDVPEYEMISISERPTVFWPIILHHDRRGLLIPHCGKNNTTSRHQKAWPASSHICCGATWNNGCDGDSYRLPDFI